MARKRIGIALTHKIGNRRSEYGIYKCKDGSLYARYEGFRMLTIEGEIHRGLPFTGPHANWKQPFIPFKRCNFDKVRYFKEGKNEQ